jgi:choline dehydrogenase
VDNARIPADVIEADVIVVGGGSGGAVVAARLAESGRDVVLIEAGPDYGSFDGGRWPAELVDARALATSHDWQYRGGRWEYQRARVIGGCSSHNGAIAAVGHRCDYDAWRDDLGLVGWSAADVAPLFATVIERMRVRAYQRSEVVPFHEQCLQAGESLGWRIASDLCDLDAGESFGLETVNVVGTTRWNTAFAYLDPVRHLPNLRIVQCTLVDRLYRAGGSTHVVGWTVDPMPFGSEAFSAAYGSADRRRPTTFAADTLVLAAGAYGTPAILQRSGIGDPQRLRAVGIDTVVGLPGVGANLHDHPMVNAMRAVSPELQSYLDAATAAGFLPEEQTLGKFSSTRAHGVYDTHVFPVCASDQTSLLHGRVAIEVACLTPRSRGRIDIESADPFAAPQIDHRYLSDPEGHDLTVLRDGLAVADELFAHPAVAAIVGGRLGVRASSAEAVDADIRARVGHYYHPVGSCAMGHDAMSVCDERGAVYGIDGVVIADASLMPTIPRANTNLPAIMIGEHIAASLLR